MSSSSQDALGGHERSDKKDKWKQKLERWITKEIGGSFPWLWCSASGVVAKDETGEGSKFQST